MVRRSRLTLDGDRKVLAVLSHIKGEKNANIQAKILDALSRDFLLTPWQMQALCHTKLNRPNCANDASGTCLRLLPCALGAVDFRQAVLCTNTLADLTRLQRKAQALFSLCLENPIGYYNLDLSQAPDRCVAERLLLLNRWQIRLWYAAGLIDISEDANEKA